MAFSRMFGLITFWLVILRKYCRYESKIRTINTTIIVFCFQIDFGIINLVQDFLNKQQILLIIKYIEIILILKNNFYNLISV